MSDNKEITLTRTFDAPRELVYEAWTTPEHWAAWWSGGGFTTPTDSISMDVRPGGKWQSTMKADDGSFEVPFFGVYTEVSKPEKLVYSLAESANPSDEDLANAAVVKVELSDTADGKTELVFSQVGPLPDDHVEEAKQGWVGLFDSLEAHLATAKS